MRLILVAAMLIALLGGEAISPVAAQSTAFAPRVLVDDRVVTQYEYEQRLRFMRLLNAPGDLVQEAEKTLIEDRLRLIAAKRLKIRLSAEEILGGMTEFAGRFEMPLEEFVKILEQNGVATATYRDFVHAGLVWREVVRRKFGERAPLAIYEPEIDRALSAMTQAGTTRLLLSEILLPTAKRLLARELAETLRGEAAFAAAARQHSQGETATDGGRLDWRNAAALPQPVLAAISAVERGQVTQPVRVEGGYYALYLLRQVEERPALTPQTTAIDYSRLVMADDAAQLARLQAQVRSCNDLNAFAGTIERQTVAQSVLSADLAARLAPLDDNEMVIRATGTAQEVLMLCSRQVLGTAEPDRDTIRGRLVEARLTDQAELYLHQLRANAHIRRP